MFTLSDFWAKTDKSTGLPSLTVVDHSMIVGTVAQVLEKTLPALKLEALPEGKVTLIAAHDIGKITPGFQLKCPSWTFREAVEVGLQKAGLCSAHPLVSHYHLRGENLFFLKERLVIGSSQLMHTTAPIFLGW